MWNKIKDTWRPILFFLLTLTFFILFYRLFFREYLALRVYPVKGDPTEWISSFDGLVNVSIALCFLINILWFIVSWTANPEPGHVRMLWTVFFILSFVTAIALPVIFLVMNGTTSGGMNAAIFAYFFLGIFLVFNAASIISYSEIKYCHGIWKYIDARS